MRRARLKGFLKPHESAKIPYGICPRHILMGGGVLGWKAQTLDARRSRSNDSPPEYEHFRPPHIPFRLL